VCVRVCMSVCVCVRGLCCEQGKSVGIVILVGCCVCTGTYVFTDGSVESAVPFSVLRTTVSRGSRLTRPPGGSVGHPVAN